MEILTQTLNALNVCMYPMPAFSYVQTVSVYGESQRPDWSEAMLSQPNPMHSQAAELVLSKLDTLPVVSCSKDACAFVPSPFVLLRARRAAASICFFVCWYIVLAYDIGLNSPSMSYCDCDGDVWSFGVCVYEDVVEVDMMEGALRIL